MTRLPLPAPVHVVLLLVLCLPAMDAEARRGEKAHEERMENLVEVGDEAVVTYVRRVGNRIVRAAGYDPADYHFTVVDDAAVNAFAGEGGYIYIFRGLMAFLETEDQLAAVLAHEVGHVVGNHIGRQKRNAMMSKAGGFLASIFTGYRSVGEVVEMYSAEDMAGFGREMELEADDYGARFLAAAGYNPTAMIEVIQVLKDQEVFARQVANQPPQYHGLFATHPKNDKRLHQVVNNAWAAVPAEVQPHEGDYLEVIDGLAWGSEANGGVFVETTWYHGRQGIVVAFPEDWRTQRTSQRVVAEQPGRGRIAYIALEATRWDGKEAPRDFVTDTLKLEVDEGAALEVGEFAGWSGELTDPGKGELRLVAVLFKDGIGYVFKGELRDAAQADAFREHFRTTVASFRRFTRDDLQVANTQRIELLEARPGLRYAELAEDTALGRHAEEQLRLLNGDYPNGEPRAGDRVKIVR